MLLQRNLRWCLRLPRMCRHNSTEVVTNPQVCVVGSGPAGFYTAQHLLKHHPTLKVDMYEKLPVPFGLVRFGVAPDHPEVKNVINSFTKTANQERFSFVGNVTVGKDVVLEDLQEAYHIIVFAYGASEDREIGIPGEEFALSARRIVGWYNGLEEDAKFSPNLDVEEVAIIGHGNVALDVARILLMSVDTLKTTDITQHALDVLTKSRVKRVHLFGRRGPLQVAFTIKELREQINLPGCDPVFPTDLLQPLQSKTADLPRPRKRITELMIKTALEGKPNSSNSRQFHLHFLRSPLEIMTSQDTNKVCGLKLEINELQETGDVTKAVPTGKFEDFPCDMVVRSVGYKSLPLSEKIPFDTKNGVYIHQFGRIKDCQGLYCSGWVKTGPVGVILSTLNDSFSTADVILKDLKDGRLPASVKDGKAAIDTILRNKGVQAVSFTDWLKIDRVEKERGEKVGKPREKIISSEEMLRIAHS